MYAYGDTVEADRIWSEMSGQAQVQYRDESFLREVRSIRLFAHIYVCLPY